MHWVPGSPRRPVDQRVRRICACSVHHLFTRFSVVPASFVHPSHERSCSTLSPVSTGMGDRLWAGIPPWHVTEPTRSTHPCVHRVPALTGWGKGGNITSAGWQVTLCDPTWHVISRSGEACLRTAIYSVYLLYSAASVAPPPVDVKR